MADAIRPVASPPAPHYHEVGSDPIETYTDIEGLYRTLARLVKTVNRLTIEVQDLKYTDLDDTPSALSDDGLKYVRVNSAGTALEHTTFPTLISDFTDLSDTPGSYASGDGSKLVKVNAAETALEFAGIQEGSGAWLMTELASDPATPPTGQAWLYFKAAGLYMQDDVGTVTQVKAF